jgi:putative spermidine/putrescine transport system ATP-binding protein
MRGEIRRIHQSLGSTTIYVTHDQEEALSLADRIVVIREGVIRQVGTPAELYGAPAHLDVADFMGFRNRVPGRVIARDGDVVTLDVGDGARISGHARDGVGEGAAAVAMARPDDLVPTDSPTGIPAEIETIEYRGREYHGLAKTANGLEVFFSSATQLGLGAKFRLGADPDRVLVYPEETP